MQRETDFFQMLSLTGSPLRIVLSFPKLFAGKPIVHESIFDNIGTEVQIRAPEPRLYTIDGDLYTFEEQLSVAISEPVSFIVG